MIGGEATKQCPGGGAPRLLLVIQQILAPAFAASAINICEVTQLGVMAYVSAWQQKKAKQFKSC
jgi:hypothetical protein